MDPERAPPEPEEPPKGIGAVEISLTVVILLLLAGTGIYYALQGKTSVGQATLTPETATGKIEKFFKSFGIGQFVGDNTKLCLITPLNGHEASFAVRKTNGVVTVHQAGAYGCDGATQEDFIVHYISAERFSTSMESPNCRNFIDGNGKNGYVYLPSKLWAAGENKPTCNPEFKERYCAAVAYCMDPPLMLLPCCATDQLSPLAQKRVNEARALGTRDGGR